MVENPKFRSSGAYTPRHGVRTTRPALRFGLHRFARDEALHLFFADLSQSLQICHLFFQVVLSSIKPEPATGAPVNSERPTDRVPELTRPEFVMLREDFDSFGQPHSLDRHPEPQCQVVDVNAA